MKFHLNYFELNLRSYQMIIDLDLKYFLRISNDVRNLISLLFVYDNRFYR